MFAQEPGSASLRTFDMARSAPRRLFTIALLVWAPLGCAIRQEVPLSTDGQRLDHASKARSRRVLPFLASLLNSVGGRAEEKELSDMFTRTDTNGDGFVDRMEYMYGARDSMDDTGMNDKPHRDSIYDYLSQIYERADMDSDGVLCERELLVGQYLSAEENHAAKTGYAPSARGGFDFGTRAAKRGHKKADADSDGKVDVSEFGQVWAGGYPPFLANRVVDGMEDFSDAVNRLAGEADIDEDGGLTWEEFRYATYLVTSHVAQEVAKALISDLDRDGDGSIAKKEVSESIAMMRESKSPILGAARQVRNNFLASDFDSEGLLDKFEVVAVAKRLLAAGEL